MTGERTQIVLTSPLRHSITPHATLNLPYCTSMLPLQNSVISRALWLPQPGVILQSLECIIIVIIVISFHVLGCRWVVAGGVAVGGSDYTTGGEPGPCKPRLQLGCIHWE